ncbi:protein of unknown function [Burkholderia multivorans]
MRHTNALIAANPGETLWITRYFCVKSRVCGMDNHVDHGCMTARRTGRRDFRLTSFEPVGNPRTVDLAGCSVFIHRFEWIT